jgi:hypothetical protein
MVLYVRTAQLHNAFLMLLRAKPLNLANGDAMSVPK